MPKHHKLGFLMLGFLMPNFISTSKKPSQNLHFWGLFFSWTVLIWVPKNHKIHIFVAYFSHVLSIVLFDMLNFVSTSKKTHFTEITLVRLVFLMNCSDMVSQAVFSVNTLGYLSYKSHFLGLFFSWTNDCVFPYA